jgi:hypothetical protein
MAIKLLDVFELQSASEVGALNCNELYLIAIPVFDHFVLSYSPEIM